MCVCRMIVPCGDSAVWTVLYNKRSNQIFPVDLYLPGSVDAVLTLSHLSVEVAFK